jgi:hypothetical protein
MRATNCKFTVRSSTSFSTTRTSFRKNGADSLTTLGPLPFRDGGSVLLEPQMSTGPCGTSGDDDGRMRLHQPSLKKGSPATRLGANLPSLWSIQQVAETCVERNPAYQLLWIVSGSAFDLLKHARCIGTTRRIRKQHVL